METEGKFWCNSPSVVVLLSTAVILFSHLWVHEEQEAHGKAAAIGTVRFRGLQAFSTGSNDGNGEIETGNYEIKNGLADLLGSLSRENAEILCLSNMVLKIYLTG